MHKKMFRFNFKTFYFLILIAASSCVKIQTKTTYATPTIITTVNVTFAASSSTLTTIRYNVSSQNSENIRDRGSLGALPEVNSTAKKIHISHDHNNLKANESAQTNSNDVNAVDLKNITKRANLNTSKTDLEDVSIVNVLRSSNKTGSSNRDLCPSFKNGAEISLDELSGVWMTLLYRAAQFVQCFRIRIRKISFQVRHSVLTVCKVGKDNVN